jgi:serine/threonine protein kinase
VPPLKKQLTFETAFGLYVASEILGEGGAGRVYGGKGPDGSAIALKVLAEDRASSDKRQRFKNEIGFLSRNKHENIVVVIDHGVARGGLVTGPFYVMRRYDASLRRLIADRIRSEQVLAIFSQILDGVEAAHLQGVVHRDIKPENILFDAKANQFAVADFGIARFSEDLLATLVETADTQRLANFQYAAPEQRALGMPVSARADIYALGLVLNEMFTGVVPHGTDYRKIASVSDELAFLDPIVERMLRQSQDERPGSIAEIKGLIQRHSSEAVSLQKLSKLNNSVVRVGEIDEPLATEPPKVISVDWQAGSVFITLDRPVTQAWIQALHDMGNYSSVMGSEPETFKFQGNVAVGRATPNDVQFVVNNFKDWLPKATRRLRQTLERHAQQEAAKHQENLRRERQAEEQRLQVLRNLKF